MKNDYKDTIVITNRKLVSGDYLKQLEKVVSLGPRGLILREKDLTDMEYARLAVPVLELCAAKGVPCFLHSHLSVAKQLDCRRIHLSLDAFRELVAGEGDVELFDEISVSCHSMEDVQYAVQNGATQIVLGTIFETDCKKGLAGKGPGFVREICSECSIPVYAIGGINLQNLKTVQEAGAAGGCMMSGFMKL